MTPFKRHRLIHSAVTGPSHQGEHKQQQSFHHDMRPVYFNIEIQIDTIEMGYDEPWPLQAGISYIILVFPSANQLKNQNPIIVTNPITITLRSGHPALKVEEREYQIKSDIDWDKVYHFTLYVDKSCPKDDYELLLLYRESKSIRNHIAATEKVHVDGDEIESSVVQSLFKAARIDSNKELPPDTAILYVVDPSIGKLQLQGWSRKKTLDTIEIPTFSEVSLAKFVERSDHPEMIRNRLHNFSRRSLIIVRQWFKDLYDHYGSNFCLVIADETAFELPWELLQIQSGTYLGVLARIVRWFPFNTSQGMHKLSLVDTQYQGDIIAYVDVEEIHNNDEERNLLNKHNAQCYTSVNDLINRLSSPLNGISLVYLACHGIFSYNEKHKIAVGSLINPSNRLLSLDLECLDEHSNKETIIFINACHSARLIIDDSGVYGLPEVALALFANGYIGTMGPVGSEAATQIANQIIDMAHSNTEGVNIAEILRQIRADAVQRIQENPNKADWFNFIYTFMYVYYGNPFARLKVHPRLSGDGHD